jgi:hypothetical protein
VGKGVYMSIPNKPMSGFEKFDIKKVSPSQIGNYTSRRSRWVIEKIFKKIVTVGASAHRGTTIEHGIEHFLRLDKLNTGDKIAESVDVGVKKFDDKCRGMMKYEEERNFIEPCIRKGIEEFRKFDLLQFQAELQLYKAKGEIISRDAEQDKVETLYGQAQGDLANAQAAVDKGKADIMGGVGGLLSGVAGGFTSGAIGGGTEFGKMMQRSVKTA